MEKTGSKKIDKAEKTTVEDGPFAVAVIGGKQHIVHEGDILSVENLDEEVGQKITQFDVLFCGSGSAFSFGTPTVDKAVVEVEVLANYKGKKIDVIKFKAKSRYSKKTGHRSHLTKVKVLKIKGVSHGT